jgi:regulator of sirC expression with transglutaminase-like and TPR domain
MTGFAPPNVYLIRVNSTDFDAFASAIAGRPEEVDLFSAAMVIARLGGHDVDPHRAARTLDLIAEDVLAEAGERPSLEALAHALDHQLFTVAGFRGSFENYDDPENSYLDRVIERRVGIPIALSVVYLEIAQRVGLPADGIGFPGHFLVRYGEPGSYTYLDPFQQGTRLDEQELLAMLRGLDLGGARPETFLTAVTRRQILQRMLNNLHASFRARRDIQRWHDVIELQLRLEPWNVALIGERGMLRYRLGRLDEALPDLETYVSVTEKDASPGAIRLLDQLRLRYRNMGESR